MTDRLIRITTALAVVALAGITAHLLPFTVDGLIWAASMVVLDASHQHHPVPPWQNGT